MIHYHSLSHSLTFMRLGKIIHFASLRPYAVDMCVWIHKKYIDKNAVSIEIELHLNIPISLQEIITMNS